MKRSTFLWTLVALVLIALLAGCTLSAQPTTPSVEGTLAAGTDLPPFPPTVMGTQVAGPTSNAPQPQNTNTPPKPTAASGQQPTAKPPAATVPPAATATSSNATPVAPANTPAGGTATTSGSDYTVKAGDNLFRISLAYNMSWTTVAAYNGIGWPYFVYVGQVIHIPPTSGGQAPSGKQYVVQAGDTLFRVALAYNLPYTTLASFNNIPYPYYIYPGQVINIP